MKLKNDIYEVKIVNPPRRPEGGGEGKKQQKPKSPSPLIIEIKPPKPGGQVQKKPPSEPKPITLPKPSPEK